MADAMKIMKMVELKIARNNIAQRNSAIDIACLDLNGIGNMLPDHLI